MKITILKIGGNKKTFNMGTAPKKPRAKRSVRSGRKKMELFKKNQDILKKVTKGL